MTSATTDRDVRQIAARAALDVSGVAGLQPTLADHLAAAAPRAWRAMVGAATLPAEAGVRIERTAEDGWHVEVRCATQESRRVLDVAQQVREDVRAAVSAFLAQHGSRAPVTVLVTVIHTG
ncbi:Asp23/Gls24 family envelope stress response protein [Streptomyces sp. NPDC059866]|uniref:Asp23/Gls24 family envelope stress response protein n=1 Tax=unclassified Streptomyces TaxID=2593676 RepID=UPI00363B1EF9